MGIYGHPDGTIEHIRIKETRWADRPKVYKLNDCQKCGSKRVDLWYVGAVGAGGWRGICHDCQYLPDRLCDTDREAVDLWNGVIT